MKKRSIIRKKLRRAQAKGKSGAAIDPHYYASCEGKIQYSKDQIKNKTLYSTQKFYKCLYGDHYHTGRMPGVHKRKGRYESK